MRTSSLVFYREKKRKTNKMQTKANMSTLKARAVLRGNITTFGDFPQVAFGYTIVCHHMHKIDYFSYNYSTSQFLVFGSGRFALNHPLQAHTITAGKGDVLRSSAHNQYDGVKIDRI